MTALRFLVDEDLPRSLAVALSSVGFSATDVRDAGLRGHSDDAVWARALREERILVTGDLGFSNPLRYAPATHPGLVIARFPNEIRSSDVVAAIVRALGGLDPEEIRGNVLIIEPGRLRLRRSPAPG